MSKGKKKKFVQIFSLVPLLLQSLCYLGFRKKVFWATLVGEREKIVQKGDSLGSSDIFS